MCVLAFDRFRLGEEVAARIQQHSDSEHKPAFQKSLPPEVEFWVRNLLRKNTSFRLQTSSDWFYPDFLCQLSDGRVMTVEYKGKHLYSAGDAEEKRAVGAACVSRSGGKCLFAMPTEGDFSQLARMVRLC